MLRLKPGNKKWKLYNNKKFVISFVSIVLLGTQAYLFN